MTNIGSSITAGAFTGQTPKVYNKSAPTANVEVSQVLSTGVKRLEFKSRLNGNLQYTFTSGESGTKFITVPKFASESLWLLNTTSLTLYIQSDKAGDVIEILEFT